MTVMAVGRALLLATGLVWIALELNQGRARRPEAVKADRGSRVVVQVAVAIGYLVAVRVARAVPATAIHSDAVVWAGLGVLWCGIALRLWSFRVLGRYFTFTVQTSGDQPVITAGPYQVIRHPGYAGLLLAFVGMSLFTANWLSVIVLTAAVVAGLAYRIRVEEGALLRDLGEGYRTYAVGRKRLVPFVW
jgi:protein-S-isoprenylcysteine O-methyltransferase Ste14